MALFRRMLGQSLIRRFAVSSFLAIATITVVLSLVISQALRDDMLQREWHVTGGFIRLQAQDYLTASDFADPSTPDAQARFRRFYDQVRRMPEIVRLNIFDRSRTVVWSDEARLVGQRFTDNRPLAQAAEGLTIAKEANPRHGEATEAPPLPRLVELYVPLELPSVTGIVGVVETYKTPEEVFANIASAQHMVVGTALAGGALLWVSLFGIVRAASRRIDRQHHALEAHTHDLAAANEELRRVQGQLVAAGRMAAIGEVVAAIAHGIRNPLANIRASAQVGLLDCHGCGGPPPAGPAPAPAATNLVNVIGEVDRLDSRVTELLRFVRPIERPTERVDLTRVLRESLREVAVRVEHASVRVEDALAEGLPPVIGDHVLLEQAFTGLIDNAIDAIGDRGGTITLTTGVEPNGAARQVFAEVRDTGTGIRAEDLPRIFEVFFTTKARGTGLGLALARKFIEGYGGTLGAVSKPGEGAAFRATFPAAA